jgi:hypothetical protein
VSDQTPLKLLFELRAVLDRVIESDLTLHETILHDLERASRLTDSCIAHLTQDEACDEVPEEEAEE